MKLFCLIVLTGIVSTLLMDIGSGILRAQGLIAGVPPPLVGKWLVSAVKGQIIVKDIRTSSGKLVPILNFLIFHYIIGIALTGIFYFFIVWKKIRPLPIYLPLFFGLITSILPLFFMYPAMGFGLMGLNGPPEYRLIPTSVIGHLFYGVGLSLAFRLFLRKKIGIVSSI
jgi:hypothetical protein